MVDYSRSRTNNRSIYPENASAGAWENVEPLLTAQQLKDRFLGGIPLISKTVDPVTKRAWVATDEILKDCIIRAITELEIDASFFDVFPVQRIERHPYDRTLFQSWGHFKMEHSPISSVEYIRLVSGRGEILYQIVSEWIDVAYYTKGLIYLSPLLPSTTATSGDTAINATGAMLLLQIIDRMNQHPSLWEIAYTTGCPDGIVPRIVNELIGCYAAIDILSILAATNTTNTHSLGMDGMSQSVSTAGPQIYNQRMTQLQDKQKKMLGKLKALYGRKFVMGNI